MSNRDENLQKINDELEKLSDEQLDQVAGGTGTRTGASIEELMDSFGPMIKKLTELFKNYPDLVYHPEIVYDPQKLSEYIKNHQKN